MTTFLAAIAVSLLAALLKTEIEGWLPHLATLLARWAAGRLPADKQERYAEEWAAYLDAVPGPVSKILTAAGFVIAADRVRMPLALRARFAVDFLFGAALVIYFAPLLIIVGVAVTIVMRRVPLVLITRRSAGRDFSMFAFPICGHDSRTGWFGRFLLRTDLARLPRILNLVRGDLTLVGPTPLPPRMADEVGVVNDPFFRAGLFCEGVGPRYAGQTRDQLISDLRVEARLHRDNLNNWSLWNDLKRAGRLVFLRHSADRSRLDRNLH